MPEMQKFLGKSANKGIAQGPVMVIKNGNLRIRHEKISNVQSEIKRVESAVKRAREQLQTLYTKASEEIGESVAAIFKVHRMILEDEEYLGSIRNIITAEMVNAEYAVAITGEKFTRIFSGMDDEYVSARAADMKDISDRLLRILDDREDTGRSSEAPVIIVAEDLSPSETIQMDREKVLAFVT